MQSVDNVVFLKPIGASASIHSVLVLSDTIEKLSLRYMPLDIGLSKSVINYEAFLIETRDRSIAKMTTTTRADWTMTADRTGYWTQ
jgi:hypothetical protein